MTKLFLDAVTLAKLHNLDADFELCDESGKTLGYFHPSLANGKLAPSRSPFSDADLRRRRQERTGRPLADILERLGNS
jgi:hypothetical protein